MSASCEMTDYEHNLYETIDAFKTIIIYEKDGYRKTERLIQLITVIDDMIDRGQLYQLFDVDAARELRLYLKNQIREIITKNDK